MKGSYRFFILDIIDKMVYQRFLSSYVYIKMKNNIFHGVGFRKEILRNDKFINFGKSIGIRIKEEIVILFQDFYFKIFDEKSFLSFFFYFINFDFKLYIEFRSKKVFRFFQIILLTKAVYHKDVEISGRKSKRQI